MFLPQLFRQQTWESIRLQEKSRKSNDSRSASQTQHQLWLAAYVPFLTLPPVWLARSFPEVSRKQGLSRSTGLKTSSGDTAWSMWGQSSLARAALDGSPFTLKSPTAEKTNRQLDSKNAVNNWSRTFYLHSPLIKIFARTAWSSWSQGTQ